MLKAPRHLAFFITGHGFGHGVRESSLINALPPEINVTIFTSLPELFFREELKNPFTYEYCEIDCGCIQRNTIEVDIIATLEAYQKINAQRDELIAHYSQRLKDIAAEGVIGDIPPLAFPIAQAANLSSWAIGNFSWAEIYAPYIEAHPQYAALLVAIKADYALATQHFYLHPGFPQQSFPQSLNIGILARQGESRRHQLAERFGLNNHKKWCLVYMGNYGLDGVVWKKLAELSEWEFFGLYALAGAAANYHILQKDADYSYADLTASCDLVLGKLGYGLVSECLAYAKPVLFLGRRDFCEFEALKSLLEKKGQGLEISWEKLQNLQISTEMGQLMQANVTPEPAHGVANFLSAMGYK